MTFVLAALVHCPLLSGGVMVYPTLDTIGFRLYIQNPSSFPQTAGSVEIVIRDPNRSEYHVVLVPLNKTIPAQRELSIDLGPRPDITDDPALVAGSHINC